METKIQKWGNSLAVRLPKAFAEQTGIENGSKVHMILDDGKITLFPVINRALLLDRLLEEIDESNLHQPIDFGAPMGKELL